MTDMLDPVELLNSMSPPAGWNDPPDLATDERAASILERVVSGNVIPFRAPRRRLKIVTGVVVTLTLGGAGVAALLQRSADEDRVVSCWSEAAPDPAAKVGLAWDGTTDPVEKCMQPWTDGTLGTAGPPAPLQLCITTEDGIVAAIPGNVGGACASLGLAPFVPDQAAPDGDDADVNALTRLLERKYNRDTCFTEQEALSGVRRTLEEFGFDGWATQALDATSVAETCVSVSIDRKAETVYVVAVDRPTETPN